jgi:hypothetical protein
MMDKGKRMKEGIKSGYAGLVFRPSGEYESLNDESIVACGGPGFVDGWYVCIEWNDGSRFPYPLAVLDPGDDDGIELEQAQVILESQAAGAFDAAHAEIQRLGITSSYYIKEEYRDKITYPPARSFFGL